MGSVDAGFLRKLFGMLFKVFLHVGLGGGGDIGGDFLVELPDLGVFGDLLADAIKADPGRGGELFEGGAFGDGGSDLLHAPFDLFVSRFHAFFLGGVGQKCLLNELVHYHLLNLRLDHGALLGRHLLELASIASGKKFPDISHGDLGAINREDDIGFGDRRCGRGTGSSTGSACRRCYRRGRGGRGRGFILRRGIEGQETEAYDGRHAGQGGGYFFHIES